MNLITKILNEDHEKFEKELNERKKVLTNRANTFIKECEKVDLLTLPFTCGFFITIPCNNPLKTYENLVKRDVHIIPLDNCIRITIASISLDECKKIPSIIKEELI
jgi:aromatic-amino-acid transaminase